MVYALHVIGPLFAFMLLPLWIPLIAFVVGTVLDRFRPRTEQSIHQQLAHRREAVRVAAVAQPA